MHTVNVCGFHEIIKIKWSGILYLLPVPFFFQVLLFSATFNEMITKFIPRVMKDHNKLFLRKEELSLEAVKQYKVYCPDELIKIDVIKTKIFELGANIGQRIIFVRSRNSAKMLHEELVGDGYSVTTIHGALSVEDRDKIVKEFKDGLTKVLISTDLLARGFDQQQVLVFPIHFPSILFCLLCLARITFRRT